VPTGTIPLVPFAGLTVKVFPLHEEAVMLVMEGIVLTVMVTMKVLPVQVPDKGVTV
jgi:hypothetical protein